MRIPCATDRGRYATPNHQLHHMRNLAALFTAHHAAVLYNGVCDGDNSPGQIYRCLELKPVPPSTDPVIVMTWTMARPLRQS